MTYLKEKGKFWEFLQTGVEREKGRKRKNRERESVRQRETRAKSEWERDETGKNNGFNITLIYHSKLYILYEQNPTLLKLLHFIDTTLSLSLLVMK